MKRNDTLGVSPSGDRVAVLLSSGAAVRVAIYQSPPQHQQSGKISAWVQQTSILHRRTISDDASYAKVFFVSDNLVAVAVMGSELNSCLIVWDLRRGIVIQEMNASGVIQSIDEGMANNSRFSPMKTASPERAVKNDQRMVSVAVHQEHLYVAVLIKNTEEDSKKKHRDAWKCLVHEYSTTAGSTLQLIRKIKLGSVPSASLLSYCLLASENRLAWGTLASSTATTATLTVRLVSVTDGSRIGSKHQSWSVILPPTSNCSLSLLPSMTSITKDWLVFLACPTDDESRLALQAIQLWDGQHVSLLLPSDTSKPEDSSRGLPLFMDWLDNQGPLQVQLVNRDPDQYMDVEDALPSWSLLVHGTQLYRPHQFLTSTNADESHEKESKKRSKKEKKRNRESTESNSATGADLVLKQAGALRVDGPDNITPAIVKMRFSNRLYALVFDDADNHATPSFQVQCHELPPSFLDTSSAVTSFPLQWFTSSDVASSERGKKRPNASTVWNVLGPGQAGGNASGAADDTNREDAALSNKKLRLSDADNTGSLDMEVNDDDEEDKDDEAGGPTIAERLQKLREALDARDDSDDDDETDDFESSDEDGNDAPHDSEGLSPKQRSKSALVPDFKPRQATTESLGKLLRQALHSADAALLELALDVRDMSLVNKTIETLSDDELIVLGTALTSRLAGRPSRAAHLVTTWIRAMLQSGRWNDRTQLQILRNIIHDRLEIFPALLQLDGRLSMIT
jgi:hypothetical protein